MSSALVGGLIGLLGIVLGTAMTTWTTRQTTARSDRQAWLETRRQEFRSAVTQFASALLAYRLAEGDYWTTHHGGKANPASGREAYRLRAAVLDGLCLLDLSSDDDHLKKLARDALNMAHKIRDAGTQAEMGDRTHKVREALDDVIKAARIAEPGRSRAGEPSKVADLSGAQDTPSGATQHVSD